MKLFPKFLLAVLFCLLAATTSHAQLNKYVIQCQQGGQTVTTSGVTSSTKHPISYTSSTIRIYQAGTTTDASLFSDVSGITPLANPNTCNSVAQFTFYTSEISIDSRLSPTGVTPFTTSGVGPNVIGYASTTRAGITKLSVAPASSTNPIAVGSNDPVLNSCVRPYLTLGVTGAGTLASPYAGWESTVWSGTKCYFFGGPDIYYTTSSAPNWNFDGIKIFGGGATILYTGTGVGMQVNNATGYNNEILIQDFHVSGNASATDGLLVSGVARSVFRNIWVSKFPQKAAHLKFAVADTFDNVTLSINADGSSVTPHPQYGLYLEDRSGASEPTEGNNFQNVVIEGATVAAIFGNHAISNNFYVQTLEANAAGAVLTNGSDSNNFFGGDYEANGTTFTPYTPTQGVDFNISASKMNSLWGIFSTGTITIGDNTDSTFISGQITTVTVSAAANGTHFGQFNIRTGGSITNNSNSTYFYGTVSPVYYTIGGQKLTSVSATTLRVQPTAAGQLSIINTPSGNNGSVLSLDSTDRVADASNIAGFGMFANAGAAIRLYAVGVGTAPRQNIELCADQATPNSSSCGNQLKLPTTGGVQIGGGTTLLKVLSGTASLDFGATAAGTCDTLTIAVTGAADGDTVMLGIPNALATADVYQSFHGFVSSAGVVSVKRCNLTNATTALSNPSAATVRATVLQF